MSLFLPVEYTPQTTANAACLILDDCVKIVGLENDDITSIKTYSGRSTLLNDDMPDIAFNDTAIFYRGNMPIDMTAEYTRNVTNDELEPCVVFYPEDIAEKAMAEDEAASNIIEFSEVVNRTYDALFKGRTIDDTYHEGSDIDHCNSVIDEFAVARLITVGIAASRIPADINLIKTTTSKDVTSVVQQRIYDKLHKVVRSVNSRIAKSVDKKQPKSVFLAHARLWHAAAKPGKHIRLVKEEHENFRRELGAARV